MSTSLAKQLKNLSQGDTRAQSGARRVSLLFSQREAAAMDLDDVFDLGCNGLLELALLDERFQAHPLLSAQARRTDRESQSQEENRRLDELLSQFLLLLSPFFMTRACHKVLEWLLRRFSIHRFNVLDVMACLLPYHETVIACRLVQLLVIDKTLFSFFEGVRKTGAPMPRQVLIERCVHSQALLPFLFERVQASLALGISNRALTSLFASLCVGVLRLRPSEDNVRNVLSLAIDACKSTDANLKAASHMALAQLCASVQLEQDAIDAVTGSLDVTDLSLLCLIFQTQPLARAPRALALQLLTQSNALLQASAKYEVSVLVSAVLQLVLDPEVADVDALITAWKPVADQVGALMSSESVKNFVCGALLQCARATVAPHTSFIRHRLAVALLSLGSEAGLGVAAALQACSSDGELCSRVERLAVEVFGPVSCHSPLPGSGTTMMLALSHKDPRVRQLGLTAVDKELRTRRMDSHHLLAEAACALALDADVQIAEFVIASPWFPTVAGNNIFEFLKNALNSSHLADQRLVRAALPVALAANLDHGVAALLEMCVLKLSAQGHAILPYGAVVTACYHAATEGHVSHPLVTALGNLSPAAALSSSGVGEGARGSKKQRSSSKTDASTTAKTEVEGGVVGGLKALILCIAEVCKSKFEKCWASISAHLNQHALLLVCRELLFSGNSSHVHVVAARACEMLLALSKSTEFQLLPAMDDGGWRGSWSSSLSNVAADCIVALAQNAPLALAKQVFVLCSCLVSSDGGGGGGGGGDGSDEAIATVYRSLLSRLDEDVVLFVCSLQACDEKLCPRGPALVQVRSLHLLEAAFQAAAKTGAPSADVLLLWVASLLISLQSSNGRIRRAALRCVARLAKIDTPKKGGAFVVLLLKAVDQGSGEVKNSGDALALIVHALSNSHGSDLLSWVKQSLADKRIGAMDGAVFAILRAIRKVGTEGRIELLESRLSAALDEVKVEEATVLLEGLAGCAGTLGKHEDSLSLLLKALSSREDAIVASALSIVVPALWSGLQAPGKRLVLASLCHVSSTRSGELAASAARVAREIGAAKGSDIVAAELRLNLQRSSTPGSKKAKQVPAKEVLVEELARLEVVLELLRASRGGDSVTASALVSLLGELSDVASKSDASNHDGEGGGGNAVAPLDFTVQLALSVLTPLVEAGTAKLGENGVDVLLRCLYANHTPHLRKAVLSVLSASADRDPMPVARQILTLFRADAKELVAVDNKMSFRVMRGLLEKVLPHLSEEHRDRVLDTFVRSLPTIPQHRQLVLLESAARFLPGQPLGQILSLVLSKSNAQAAGDRLNLASGLCAELGPVATTEGLIDFVDRSKLGHVVNRFVADTLSSDGFVKSCVAISTIEEAQTLQDLLGQLFRKMLSRLEETESGDEDDEMDENDEEVADEKQNQESIYDAIDSINELFTVSHFLSVVKELLVHVNHEVRFRASRVLNERVASHRGQGMTTEEQREYGAVFPVLEQALVDVTDDRVLQALFLSIDILGRSVGAANATQSLSSLAAVARLIRGKPRGELFASGLLTISALCSKLGPVVLPMMGDYLQLFLEALTASSEISYAALSGLFEIVSSLGAFLGPFCEPVLHACLQPALLPLPNLQRRCRQIADAFAQTLAPRLLAPVLQKLAVSEESPAAVKEMVRAAGFASTQTSRPADLRLLWAVCVSAFESQTVVRDHSVILDAAEAAAEVAFHLSESEFRPLFQALIDSVSVAAPSPRKCAPVFCVAAALLKRLKALAVPWVCKLSSAAAHVLTEREEDAFASRVTVDMLHQMFANDQEGAISKEIHTQLIDPLVDCFASDDLRDKACAAAVEMAKSMASDALWKPLNYQILLKMRSRDKKVQLACLKTIHRFWEEFKEDFLLLLPDVLPFLGEVMEEEDDEVVKSAQQLLAVINALLPNNITF